MIFVRYFVILCSTKVKSISISCTCLFALNQEKSIKLLNIFDGMNGMEFFAFSFNANLVSKYVFRVQLLQMNKDVKFDFEPLATNLTILTSMRKNNFKLAFWCYCLLKWCIHWHNHVMLLHTPSIIFHFLFQYECTVCTIQTLLFQYSNVLCFNSLNNFNQSFAE